MQTGTMDNLEHVPLGFRAAVDIPEQRRGRNSTREQRSLK